MQTIMNLKIKYRESFRPFAPSVKAEKVSEWFDLDTASPYMLLVSDVHQDKQIKPDKADLASNIGLKKLMQTRSQIPAITHVDYTARVQTVHKETNPKYWHLIDAFEQLTNVPILINTSFNVRGEPIVSSPEDAYRCFMRTEMDYLVMENIILQKEAQPKRDKNTQWQNEFELD
jgi:carbamoyltransferase